MELIGSLLVGFKRHLRVLKGLILVESKEFEEFENLSWGMVILAI